MNIKQDIKDFQVAREMFGSNTKEQCHLVKKLREKGEIIAHCDGWSLISLPNSDADSEYPTINQWLIPNEILE